MRSEALYEVVNAVKALGGPLEIYAKEDGLLVRVPEDHIPSPPWPEGVVFEALPEKTYPPLDKLVSLAEALKIAHEQGATRVTKDYIWKAIVGYRGRKQYFKEGETAFQHGSQWFVTREALQVLIDDRLANMRNLLPRPSKKKAAGYAEK